LHFQPKPLHQFLTHSQKAAQQMTLSDCWEFKWPDHVTLLSSWQKIMHNTGKQVGYKSQQEAPIDLPSCLYHKFYDDHLEVGLLCQRSVC